MELELRAVDLEMITACGIYRPAGPGDAASGATKIRTKLTAWLLPAIVQLQEGGVDEMGVRLVKQREIRDCLCPHLYRDLPPSQRPGSSYCSRRVDHVTSQQSARLRQDEGRHRAL